MIKRILIIFMLLFSLKATSQINLVFFRDVPPLHQEKISQKLSYIIPYFFSDTVALIKTIDMPEKAYCKKFKSYNVYDFYKDVGVDGTKTVCITYRDLSDSCTNRGLLGQSFDSTCIVSLYRLGTMIRLYKIVVHELGHIFGLDHCTTPKCLMEEGGSKDTLLLIDNEEDFCDKCKKILENGK